MIRPQDQPPDGGRESEPYELVEASTAAPPLPGQVIVAQTTDRLYDLLAAEMIVQSRQCVRAFGDWELALSGGATPMPLYERLMYDPDCRQIPWTRTHLWMVDERDVPPDDPRSNYRAIRETIVEHSGIPAEQVHPMPVGREHADEEYEKQLLGVLGWRERGEDRLDFVLLGLGEDGHTASLFPFHEVLGEEHRLVRRVEAPSAEPPRRLTMTLPLINAARVVVVLVTGARKAAVVRRIATEHGSMEELPIKGVRPRHGELKWFLDAAACADPGDRGESQ